MTDEFSYFDMPAVEVAARWVAVGFLVGLALLIAYLAVTA